MNWGEAALTAALGAAATGAAGAVAVIRGLRIEAAEERERERTAPLGVTTTNLDNTIHGHHEQTDNLQSDPSTEDEFSPNARRRSRALGLLADAEEARVQRLSTTRRLGIQWIANEHNNLRSAVSYFIWGGEGKLAMRLCLALSDYWLARDYAFGFSAVCEVLGLASSSDPTLARARTLIAGSLLGIRLGELGQASEWSRQASEELANTIQHHKFESGGSEGIRRLEAQALVAQGLIANEHGKIDEAREAFEQARQQCETVGDKLGEADSLNGLAGTEGRAGNYAEALRYLLESRTLYVHLSDDVDVAWTFNDEADIRLAEDQTVQAAERANAALAIAGVEQDRQLEAWAYLYLGLAATGQARFADARHHLDACLNAMLSLGDKRGLARALEASAALAEAHDGDTEGASRITAAADALRDQVKAPRVGAEGRVLQFRPRRLPEEVSLEEAVRLARHSE